MRKLSDVIAMLSYASFLNKYTLTKNTHFLAPRVFNTSEFALPRDSVLHFIPFEGSPKPSKTLLLSGVDGKLPIFFCKELPENNHATNFKSGNVEPAINAMVKSDSELRRVKDHRLVAAMHNVPYIIDYFTMFELVKYQNLVTRTQLRFEDIMSTLFTTIRGINEVASKQHFIYVEIPSPVQSFNFLSAYGKKTGRLFSNNFNTPEKLFILNIFHAMLGEPNVLVDNINILSRLNVVFIRGAKCSVVNVGHILLPNYNDAATAIQAISETADVTIEGEMEAKAFVLYLSAVNRISVSGEEGAILAELNLDDASEDDIGNLIEVSTESADDEVHADIVINKGKDDEPDELVGIDYLREKLEFGDPVVAEDITFDAALDRHARASSMTGAQMSAARRLHKESLDLVSPYKDGSKLTQAADINLGQYKIDPATKQMPDMPSVFDKGMLEASAASFDRTYVETSLKKHILAATANFAKEGVVVTKYDVIRHENLAGAYEDHFIGVKPIDGAASTLSFRVPIVGPNGVFHSNGVDYLFRKQSIDKPIRKVSPTIVALSGNMTKLFIERNTVQARDPGVWLYKRILKQLAFNQKSDIAGLSAVAANVFDYEAKTPVFFSTLAKHFRTLTAGNYSFVFDVNSRVSANGTILSKAERLPQEDDKHILVGYNATSKENVFMDSDGMLFTHDSTGFVELTHFVDLLGIKRDAVPLNGVEMNFKTLRISPMVMLIRYYGLVGALKFIGAKFRYESTGKRSSATSNELSVTLRDVRLIFPRSNDAIGMLTAGLTYMEKYLKNFNIRDLDSDSGALNLLLSMGMSSSHIREMDMLRTSFVDPITRDVLLTMHEPIAFEKLLVRAAELLTTDEHPHSVDETAMRKRGAERVPAIVYKVLTQAVKAYKNKPKNGKQKIHVDPWEVWRKITQDSSLKIPEGTNPLQELKESESVTFVGEGGRSAETLAEGSRVFRSSSIGVISEAGIDSGAVGINTFLSANSGIVDTLGMTKGVVDGDGDPTKLLSTTALVSPFALHDD